MFEARPLLRRTPSMITPESPEGLTRGTLGGLSWVYGGTAVGALAQVMYTAVMGRLLAPADFGLLAMALVFQRFGSYFAQMGVGQALIQKSHLDSEDVRVGFTTSVLLGIVFASTIAVAAPLAGTLFDTDAVVPIVRALAATFAFRSLGLVATNLLRRRLRFRVLAFLEVGSHVVSFLGVGIGMAVLGFGVWSLVGAQIAHSLLSSALAYAAIRHPLVPLFAWERIRSLYGYGARVSLISFLEFIGSSLDTLVIGRYAGQEPLGHYNRAYLLVTLPFHQIVTGLSRVLFPAFSRIQADQNRLGGAYRSALGVIAALLLPAAAGLAVAAPEIVRVVIGPQWDLAAGVLPFLAVAGAVSFLSHLGGVICDATATLNRKLALQVIHVVLLSGFLVAASRQDNLAAYALAVMASEVLRHLLYMKLMGRVVEFGFRDHLSLYGPVALAAGMVGTSVLAVSWGLRPVAPPALVLLGQVATGAFALLLSLLWGPLVQTRHDVRARLEQAGIMAGESRLARLARTSLELGR